MAGEARSRSPNRRLPQSILHDLRSLKDELRRVLAAIAKLQTDLEEEAYTRGYNRGWDDAMPLAKLTREQWSQTPAPAPRARPPPLRMLPPTPKAGGTPMRSMRSLLY